MGFDSSPFEVQIPDLAAVFANAPIEYGTPYFADTPAGGGLPPSPICAFCNSFQIAPRAVGEILPDGIHWKVYISGVLTTGLVNGFADARDVVTAAQFVNSLGQDGTDAPLTTTQQAFVNWVLEHHLDPAMGTIYGHSLGAEEAIGLGKLGWAGTVHALSPPYFLSNDALRSEGYTTIFKYSGDYDWISAGIGLGTNADRISAGVDHFNVGNTGRNTLIDPVNAHNRDTYIDVFHLNHF